jgi:PAS domain S-box-containing protein
MSLLEELKYYKEAYNRQKAARIEAESLLENKSMELYSKSIALENLNTHLDIELKRRLEEIKEKDQSFEKIIHEVSDIIYWVDLKGKFIFVNNFAVLITGYSEKELLRMKFSDLVISPDISTLTEFYEDQYLNKTSATYFEFQIRTKKGEEIWLGQNVQLATHHLSGNAFLGIARDISTRKELHISLVRSNSRYQSILENLNLGVLEVNNRDEIVQVNSSFCKMTGYSVEELIGTNPINILADESSKKIMSSVAKKRENGESSVYEIKIKSKSGKEVWILISGGPLYNEDGKVEGTIGLHLNVTERKKMEFNLKEAKDIAEDSSRAKALFLANMSHDIRTPLNAIIGLTELLQKTKLDKKQYQYLQTVSYSANGLLDLVSNILDFSKIESGNIILENNVICLDKEICLLLEPFKLQAASKNVNFFYQGKFDENQHFYLDKTRLFQILSNLISNAIKFTHTGSVSLEINSLHIDQNKEELEFIITDTGIGVSKNDQSQIFEEFVQADHKTEKNYGGTGLGLSISKKIVEALGGRLIMDSKFGKGTTLSFTATFEQSESPKVPKRISRSINWASLKILLAEDNNINQLVAKETIEQWGCKLIVVNNGSEAIDTIKKVHIDLILMDIRMPKMGGIEATKIIRGELNSKIPIIAMTANAVKGDEQNYLSIGMNGYVSKPFTEAILKETISRSLNSYEIAYFDLNLLEEQFGANSETINKLITIFIDESEKCFELINDTDDIGKLKQYVHKHKPSLHYFTSNNIKTIINEIENSNGKVFLTKLQKLLKIWGNLKDDAETYLLKYSQK